MLKKVKNNNQQVQLRIGKNGNLVHPTRDASLHCISTVQCLSTYTVGTLRPTNTLVEVLGAIHVTSLLMTRQDV